MQNSNIPSSCDEKRTMLDEAFNDPSGNVWGFARSIVRKWKLDEDAEDEEHAAITLLSKTYIRACSVLHQFRPEVQILRYWILRIMCNIRKEMIRSLRMQQAYRSKTGVLSEVDDKNASVHLLLQNPSVGKNPEDRVIVLDQLRQAIRSLSTRDRMIVILRYLYGVPIRKIAERLHWSSHHVCVRLQQISVILRNTLAES